VEVALFFILLAARPDTATLRKRARFGLLSAFASRVDTSGSGDCNARIRSCCSCLFFAALSMALRIGEIVLWAVGLDALSSCASAVRLPNCDVIGVDGVVGTVRVFGVVGERAGAGIGVEEGGGAVRIDFAAGAFVCACAIAWSLTA
jgi:hypothetical protein